MPFSAPPTGLDECLFCISLVLDPLALGFSVSSGCAMRRSVSTYAAILVLPLSSFLSYNSSHPNPHLYIIKTAMLALFRSPLPCTSLYKVPLEGKLEVSRLPDQSLTTF